MLSSGFFLKKKPHGTMPETPQQLENRVIFAGPIQEDQGWPGIIP
jgi:hypothetical protein